MTALTTVRSRTTTSTPIQSATLELASMRLQGCDYVAVRDASVSLQDGILTISGSVSSYYLKQVAQTVVQDVEGIDHIDNQLVVVKNPS